MYDLKEKVDLWMSSNENTPYDEKKSRAKFLDEITYIEFSCGLFIQKPGNEFRNYQENDLSKELEGESLIRVKYFSQHENKRLRALMDLDFEVFLFAWKDNRYDGTTMVFMKKIGQQL